jgi:peptidoglycan hydrolase-like protein with peptidoglycan-binding domain
MQRANEAMKVQSQVLVDGNFGPETTRALQVYLTRQGLNAGAIDGYFGPKVKKAFQEFLRRSGYNVGKLDSDFAVKSVRALQTWVKDNGFSPKGHAAEIDGLWGPFTTRALQRTLNAELGKSSPKRSASTQSFEQLLEDHRPRRGTLSRFTDVDDKPTVGRTSKSTPDFKNTDFRGISPINSSNNIKGAEFRAASPISRRDPTTPPARGRPSISFQARAP